MDNPDSMHNRGRINRGTQVSFDYTNHRGKTTTRRVTFDALDYIVNEFYPNGALCLTGTCKDRKATRSFDVTKISNFKKEGRQ